MLPASPSPLSTFGIFYFLALGSCPGFGSAACPKFPGKLCQMTWPGGVLRLLKGPRSLFQKSPGTFFLKSFPGECTQHLAYPGVSLSVFDTSNFGGHFIYPSLRTLSRNLSSLQILLRSVKYYLIRVSCKMLNFKDTG